LQAIEQQGLRAIGLKVKAKNQKRKKGRYAYHYENLGKSEGVTSIANARTFNGTVQKLFHLYNRL